MVEPRQTLSVCYEHGIGLPTPRCGPRYMSKVVCAGFCPQWSTTCQMLWVTCAGFCPQCTTDPWSSHRKDKCQKTYHASLSTTQPGPCGCWVSWETSLSTTQSGPYGCWVRWETSGCHSVQDLVWFSTVSRA